MTSCTHASCVYPHRTPAEYVVWCTICGASATSADVTAAGHNWRLPEREKGHSSQDEPAPTPKEIAAEQPIELALNPSELWLLMKWASEYLDADDPPLSANETLLAGRIVDAHARYLAAALLASARKGKP